MEADQVRPYSQTPDSLTQAFLSHLRVEKNLSPVTVGTYRGELNLFYRFLAERSLSWEQVGPATVTEYLFHRRKEGRVSERTACRILSTLRGFFSFLVREQIISRNPMSSLKVPRIPKRIPEVFTVKEVDRILLKIDTSNPEGLRDRALFEMIYSCGLRVSEASSLTLHSLFLKEGIVKVTGKGGKDRIVPLGGEAEYWLRKYMEEARPALLGRGEGGRQRVRRPSERLFLNRWGQPLGRKGIWKRFKDHLRQAGLEGKVHELRHSFATHLLQGGANLRAVQELLGHADISTTQIYTHVEQEILENAHAAYHPRSEA